MQSPARVKRNMRGMLPMGCGLLGTSFGSKAITYSTILSQENAYMRTSRRQCGHSDVEKMNVKGKLWHCNLGARWRTATAPAASGRGLD